MEKNIHHEDHEGLEEKKLHDVTIDTIFEYWDIEIDNKTLLYLGQFEIR